MATSVPKAAREAFRKELVAAAVCGVMVGGLYPFLGLIASRRLNASATLISLMMVAPSVGSFLAPIWANAAEGKSKMRWVSASWIIARSAFFLMVFATNRFVFVLICSASLLISSLPLPGYAYLMKVIYPDKHRGRIMSYIRMLMWLVATVVTFALGPVLEANGQAYRLIFPLAALCGVISVYIFRGIRVPPDLDYGRSEDGSSSFRDSFSRSWSVLQEDGRYAWFILTTSIYGFGNFMLFAILPKYQDEVLRMDEADLGIYSALMNVVVVLSFLYWGRCVDKRSPIRVTAMTIFVNSMLPIVFFFAPSFIWVLPAAVITGIISSGLELGYLNAVLDLAPAGQEMRYQGVQATAVGIRGIIGPLAGGLLYDLLKHSNVDVRWIFPITFAFIITGWAMLAFGIKRRFRRPRASG